MKRDISIKMEYSEMCFLSKEERDEMLKFIQRIIQSYTCADFKTQLSIADEYGKETVKL